MRAQMGHIIIIFGSIRLYVIHFLTLFSMRSDELVKSSTSLVGMCFFSKIGDRLLCICLNLKGSKRKVFMKIFIKDFNRSHEGINSGYRRLSCDPLTNKLFNE